MPASPASTTLWLNLRPQQQLRLRRQHHMLVMQVTQVTRMTLHTVAPALVPAVAMRMVGLGTLVPSWVTQHPRALRQRRQEQLVVSMEQQLQTLLPDLPRESAQTT